MKALVASLPSGIRLRLNVATAFDCPFDGPVDPGAVIAILDQLERDVAQYDRLDIGQMRTVGALQFLRLKWATTAKALVGVDPALDMFAGRPLLAAWFAPMARKKIFRQPLLRME